MSQFLVRLRGEASDALGELALRERRRHQEQAAVVLERALLRWRAAQRARPRRRLHVGDAIGQADAQAEDSA